MVLKKSTFFFHIYMTLAQGIAVFFLASGANNRCNKFYIRSVSLFAIEKPKLHNLKLP